MIEADERSAPACRRPRAALGRNPGAPNCWSSRGSATASRCRGQVEADITQACVVTLEPIEARIERRGSSLYLARGFQARPLGFHAAGEVHLDAEGPDSPETFSGDTIDVGALAEEFFGLAIDPYPRSEGASLAAAGEPDDPSKSTDLCTKSCNSLLDGNSENTRRSVVNCCCMASQNRYFRPASASPAAPGRTSETIPRDRISIDAMGGDHGPKVVIPGAAQGARAPARHALPDLRPRGRGRAGAGQVPEGRRGVRPSSIATSPCAWTTSRARRCATAAGSRRCGRRSRR